MGCSIFSPHPWTAYENGKLNNPTFYDYFCRKLGEGKTKTQALVCIKRRPANIVYGMMKNKTAYVAPLMD